MLNSRSSASRTPSSRPYMRVKGLEVEEKKRNPDYKIPTVKPISR